MKRRWLKRAAAIVLTAAMCFGPIPAGDLSVAFVVQAEETWVDTDLVKNGDFSQTNEGWTLDDLPYDSETWKYGYDIKQDSNNDSSALGIWKNQSTDSIDVSISQSVTLPQGTYKLSLRTAGSAGTANMVASVGDLASVQLENTTGWTDWKVVETTKFTVTEETTVTVSVSGTMPANCSSIYLDDIVISKLSEESSISDKVVISANPTTVEAGGTVSLTATVTYNGENVTSLTDSGVHLYWWPDQWASGHESGLNDASFSQDDSLNTVVTLQSEGTYYIAAELQDSDYKRIAIEYITITVTEPDTSDYVEADINVAKVENLSDDFIMGMDISSIMSEFDSGVTFKDFEGNTINNVTDFCKFLKTCGVTHVRVRIWNDPFDTNGKGYGGGNNDVATAVEIAKACKEADLSMLLDFHCSDFWTDPGKQQAPKAWSAFSLDEKVTALKTFLTDSLSQINATGVDIAMVQVGNETNGKFVGETSDANMCTLFNAGAEAVRTFNPDVKIVIHVTNPEKNYMTSWAKKLANNSVDYDVLATSYYPSWHGTFANLKSQLQTVKSTYGKDVMVAETSYAFTLDDTDGHENTIRNGNNDTMMCESQYPFSAQGQANYLRDLIATVNEAGGLGVYYWESAWITVGDTTGLTGDAYDEQVNANKALWEQYGSGWASSYAAQYDPNDAGVWYGGSAVDNQALFAADGSPLASVNVWKYVKTGAVSNVTTVEAIASVEETIEAGGTYTLPDKVKVTYSNGEVDETVVWNQSDVSAIKFNTAGTYVVNGTVTFSKTINGGDYADKTTANVTCTLTVKAPNLIGDDWSFANGKDNFKGLESTGKGIDGETPYDDDSKCLHWYSASATAATVTYLGVGKDGISLEPGVYTFECKAQGFAGDTVALNILKHDSDSIIASGEPVAQTGWKGWTTPAITFKIAETTKVDLQMVVGIQKGGWGTIDCMYLYQKSAGNNTNPTVPDDTDASDSDDSPAPSVEDTTINWTEVQNDVQDKVAESAVNSKIESVNMNIVCTGETQVPTTVVSSIKGTNVTVAFHSGNGVAMSISGQDLKNTDISKLQKLDLTTNSNANNIPVNVAATKTAIAQRQISVKDTGNFGIKVDMHMNVGKENADKFANMYRYNHTNGRLEYCGSFVVTKNGQAMFAMTRGGDYLVTVTANKVNETVRYMSGDYTVQAGDSLSAIAVRYHMPLAELVRRNPQLTNINLIRPGQKLNVN